MTASPDFQAKSAWTMTLLLTGLALINFLDKIVLGLVAVPLTAELKLSPEKFGVVAGSFFWLFSLSTVLVGFLSNRFQTRWLLLAMGLSWAVLQLPQAWATSALGLLVCRVILGAAEGPAFPVSVHALYKWFPDRKRNLPVAIINQGAACGMLLAGLLIPLVTREWGWRMNFFLLGAIGAVWSVLWACFGREGTLGARQAAPVANLQTPRLPYRKILTDRSVLSVFALGFTAYWTLGLSLTWIPMYFEKGLGFSGVDAGRCFAVVVATTTPVNVGLSWLSQLMLGRGVSTRRARVHLLCVSAVGGALAFIALMLLQMPPLQKVALLAIACALPTLSFSLAPALLAQMVPDSQRGALVAIHTALASLGAAFAPAVMGRIVQVYGSSNSHAYELGFTVSAVLLIVAALAALRWLHPDRSHRALNQFQTRAAA
ncbi:MFS transporter [Caballeronia insecticola]|uniref:Major facilitator superfamily (MFS) metabolite/H+ symporter n=1 Tax=Caballeronia insecticola TaxID=758793 RepID=R4X4T8_9BURK|nr:MFS transporter [Caballeronia insecticola]BAN27592.1 major facilitator superfamily (MFS) metabolite/H+ symporter [Caballeronia insecticola]